MIACLQLVLTVPLRKIPVVKAAILAFCDARSPCLYASLSCGHAHMSSSGPTPPIELGATNGMASTVYCMTQMQETTFSARIHCRWWSHWQQWQVQQWLWPMSPALELSFLVAAWLCLPPPWPCKSCRTEGRVGPATAEPPLLSCFFRCVSSALTVLQDRAAATQHPAPSMQSGVGICEGHA